MATRVAQRRRRTTRGGSSLLASAGTVAVGTVEYRFALGADAAIPDGAAYMRVDGEGTFVVGRSLKVQLLRGADAYRDRTLVPYGASEVARRRDARTDRRRGRPRTARYGVPRGRRHRSARVAGRGRSPLRSAGRRARRDLPRRRGGGSSGRAPGAGARAHPARRGEAARQPPRRRRVPERGPDPPGRRGGRAPRSRRAPRPAPRRVSSTRSGVTAESLVDRSPFVAHADEVEELRIEPVDCRRSAGGARASRQRVARARPRRTATSVPMRWTPRTASPPRSPEPARSTRGPLPRASASRRRRARPSSAREGRRPRWSRSRLRTWTASPSRAGSTTAPSCGFRAR